MFLWWILPTAHFLNAPNSSFPKPNTHESDSLSVDSCVSNGRQTSAEPCVPPTKHTQILLKNDKLTAHSSPVFIHSKHRSHSIWIPACGVSRCGMQCSSSSSHSSPCTQWCHFLFERLFTAIKGNFGYLQAQRSMCSHTHPVQLQLSSGREGLFLMEKQGIQITSKRGWVQFRYLCKENKCMDLSSLVGVTNIQLSINIFITQR